MATERCSGSPLKTVFLVSPSFRQSCSYDFPARPSQSIRTTEICLGALAVEGPERHTQTIHPGSLSRKLVRAPPLIRVGFAISKSLTFC